MGESSLSIARVNNGVMDFFANVFSPLSGRRSREFDFTATIAGNRGNFRALNKIAERLIDYDRLFGGLPWLATTNFTAPKTSTSTKNTSVPAP